MSRRTPALLTAVSDPAPVRDWELCVHPDAVHWLAPYATCPDTAQATTPGTCPSCSSVNVADLGGYSECRECGHGYATS